ncbi:MAG: GDSL-type esterase/lipase family protein [Bacteroidetes bacterium]|nr:GDSL-type esterase/lipase family protein [Bacteroidota bacterium]
MTRITFAALLLAFIMAIPDISQAQNKLIAVFGSSVANGSGDTTGSGGYAGMIKTLLEPRGWTVVNVSRGGDNTVKIMPRFNEELLPLKPAYVIIGLSLGNEGIASASELGRNRIFERFRSGMIHLIRLCRENGITPVVVNCYARNDFGKEQYEAIRKMNLLINTWDVPGIDALGAIDDGTGKWADGYWHDKSHPNEKGHREIFHAFVPGLFDALASGKKFPEKIRSRQYLSISEGASSRPLVFTPDDTIHSFTVGFQVKSSDEGIISVLHGRKTKAIVSLSKGQVICQIPGMGTVAADTLSENKGWQYVCISHRYATKSTSFYLNGKLAGSFTGPLDFMEFILGGGADGSGRAPRLAGYKDLLIYRSALNADEIQALYYDQLLQSSLEIYAPLDDPEFLNTTSAENHALSTSKVLINGDHLISATAENGPSTK